MVAISISALVPTIKKTPPEDGQTLKKFPTKLKLPANILTFREL